MPIPAVRSRYSGRGLGRRQARRELRALLDRHSFGIPRDPADTVPPEDERFTVQAVCAIECYTPSYAAGLERRLRELGFDEERSWFSGPASVRLRAHRESLGESWSNLGVVQPGGQSRFHQLELPDGLNAAFLSLYNFTPGITSLLTLFVVDERCGRRFDAESRRIDYMPRAVRIADGYRIDAPSTLKADALRAVRRETRDLASQWVKSMLPGYFAAGPYALPAVEILTTHKAVPFDGLDLPYLDFAELDWRSPDVWVSEEVPAWRLHTNWDEAVMTIAGRRSDVLATAESWTGNEQWQVAQMLQDALAKNFLLWGLIHLVASSQRRLAVIRDESVGLSARWRPLHRLKRIEGEFLRQSLESRTIAAEVGGYVGSRERVIQDASEWHGVDRWADHRLLDVWWVGLRRRTDDLGASEERLRDGLMVETTMRSTIANLRLQLYVVFLTVVAIVISVLALARTSNNPDTPREAPRPSLETGTTSP